MHISFHTDNLTPNDVQVLRAIAAAVQPSSYAAANPQPQPEVGENTGTSSTGITLSPGAAGVSEGAGAAASADQQATSSAPETSAPPAETAKRTRKPKDSGVLVGVTVTGPAVAGSAADEPKPPIATAGTAADEPKAPMATAQADLNAKDQATRTPLTIDDVRAKLQAFTGAKGIDAGLALLGEFKAGRISELKAEDYPAFVGKCEVAA